MFVDVLVDPKSYPVLETWAYPKLFVTISGSHLYGFNSPDSDVDLRGAHVGWTEEILGLDKPQESLTLLNEQYDIVTHEIEKFLSLAVKNSGFALEQVMSPLVVETSGWHAELKDLLPRCTSKSHLGHYLGFTKGQLNLMVRRPDKEVKVTLYAFRVLMTGILFAQEGRIEPNLRILNDTFNLDFVDDLIHQKVQGTEMGRLSGTHSIDWYLEQAKKLELKLLEAFEASTLPPTIQPEAKAELNDFLLRLRRLFYKNYLEIGGVITLKPRG